MEEAAGKTSGYLHFKSKKRMRTTWKHYWFVLENRLLLYYRSKEEYEAISPCKGSINLGPPCVVKTTSAAPDTFQIETRTLTYTFRSDDFEERRKWLQVLLIVLNQHQNPQPTNKLTHFRYSLDDLFPEVEPNDPKKPLQRQNTLPHKGKSLVERLQKMGAQSYGGSLNTINRMAAKKTAQDLSSSLGNLRAERAENIYERISGESRDSFVVDNDTYSVAVRRKSGREAKQREVKSVMVDNDHYASNRCVPSDEVIYAEPRVDCNENVSVENSFYASTDILNGRPSQIYEDIDKVSHYSEPKIYSSHSQSSSDSIPKHERPTIEKSKSFIKKLWKRKKKKPVEEDIYVELESSNKHSMDNQSALQALSELHKILEEKKALVKVNAHDKGPSSSPDSDCPPIPPKLQAQERSLDEILEDLDKLETKGKVQTLIEKFNEPEEIILRKYEGVKYRHDEELDRLLDELAKVTCAPIISAGTSSLVNPNLSDEEWKKLLPVRRRRLSEPDYDVPRVHTSLPTATRPPDPENALPATRFFGPVLPTLKYKDPKLSRINAGFSNESMPLSMTPDSLEVEQPHAHDNLYSYTSHNYFNQANDDKVIYALPKSYFSVATHVVNTCQNICGAFTEESTIVYKAVKNVEVQEEIFKDSLELCHETSTEF